VHRCRNRESRGGVAPQKIIAGATSTSCSPMFFCNLQLTVTLQSVRLLVTQKILENSHSFLGFAPDPIVHCVYLLRKIHTAYCLKLHFEFDCLDCFSSLFAPPKEKSSPRLLPCVICRLYRQYTDVCILQSVTWCCWRLGNGKKSRPLRKNMLQWFPKFTFVICDLTRSWTNRLVPQIIITCVLFAAFLLTFSRPILSLNILWSSAVAVMADRTA